MASLQELITAWNTGPEEPLKEFYESQGVEKKDRWDRLWMVTGRG